MEIVRIPKNTKNYLVTIAIGNDIYKKWHNSSYNSWKYYIDKYDLGLVVFKDHLISQDSGYWKKPNWQKLLVGEKIEYSDVEVENVCFLDCDILISPFAQNVFKLYNSIDYGLISIRKNLPYSYEMALKSIAYNRNKYIDHNYPLDSSLFISLSKLYEYHNLKPQKDEACTGVILFNVGRHAEELKSFYYKYLSDVTSITNDGDQTHINYELQNTKSVQWLPYSYQALWVYEMAIKYPFLYQNGYREDVNLVGKCIEASLLTNNFLHFAGKWTEGNMWTATKNINDRFAEGYYSNYESYLNQNMSGKPIGYLRMSN